MSKLVVAFDNSIIATLKKIQVPFARVAICVVYFWFGLVKLLGLSQAEPLIMALHQKTIAFVPFSWFYNFFTLFEMIIGILFLIRGLERLAIFLLAIHLVATLLPLFVLPQFAWQAFLVPTLVGQYIIKNVLIAASAIIIGAALAPYRGATS